MLYLDKRVGQTSCSFFRDALDALQQFRIFVVHQICQIPTIIKDHVEWLLNNHVK